MNFRTPYTPAVHLPLEVPSDEKVRTKQSFRKEADINFIMAKALKTGNLADPLVLQSRQVIFGDFASRPDFLQSQNRIAVFTSAFEGLPAKTRERFGNDPSRLIEFVRDPENQEEAIRLGLRPKPKITSRVEDGIKITFKDGIEIGREPIKTAPAPAPAG